MRTADIINRIAEIGAEVSSLESSGPALPSLLASSEAELADARAFFQRFGFATVGVLPAERLRNFQRSVVGALMVVGGDQLIGAERSRIEAAYRASGGTDLSPEERAVRLNELQREWRMLAAERERLWRATEASGQSVDRGAFDVEMFLASDHDLGLVAAGQEEAAA